MNRRNSILLLACALVVLVCALWLRPVSPAIVRAQPRTAVEPAQSATLSPRLATEEEPTPPPREPAQPPAVIPPPVPSKSLESVAAPPGGSSLPPVLVMQNMRGALRQYCARFGGNPVGNNREITASLNGRNRQQVVFVNPEDDGLVINERGELVDNWGTPFFFHQLSASVMEIRSAGPDRKLWTADDLVIR